MRKFGDPRAELVAHHCPWCHHQLVPGVPHTEKVSTDLYFKGMKRRAVSINLGLKLSR